MSRPRWRWPVSFNSPPGRAKKTGARSARQTLTKGNYSSKTISRLPVRSGVEALALFFRGDTQTHCQVGDLVGNGRDHSRPDDRDSHGLRLYQELRADSRVAG